jgi:RNA polymerase sigma factor (sigma-70 family)
MSCQGIQRLIARAKAGDDEAWLSLHEMVRPYLLNVAQRLLGRGWAHRSVSDLTQDTWQRVCTKIETFHGGADDDQTAALFRAWVRVTMVRVSANWRREETTQRRQVSGGALSLSILQARDSHDGVRAFDPIAEQSSVSGHVCSDEKRATIDRVLGTLDDCGDRELVRLHFFEGRSLRDIARERGVSDGSIRTRLRKILRRVGQGLKDIQ